MIIEILFLVIGFIIGVNWRNSSAEAKEQKLYSQLDEEVKKDLAITKNLNKSLLDDVRFLREKLQRLKE